MHGAAFPTILAELVFPSVRECLHGAAALLIIVLGCWLIGWTDEIIHRLFPHLEWERSLGWLNIRAERRAMRALRWVDYAIYFMLVVSLYGIIWAAEGLQALPNWADAWVMGDLALRVPALLICLSIWVIYFGWGLAPKLRKQREKAEWEELKRFREEAEEAERERGMHSPSRVKSPLPKPRTNPSATPLAPDRHKRRR